MAFPIFDNITSGIPDYAIAAFNSVEPYFWPIIFIGIIGFLYAAMSSITIAIIGILVTLAMFSTTSALFADVPLITQFLYIITVIGLALLITALFINRR